MDDTARKERSNKKTKNGVGCLLLRRSRRRANSEPPKGKRHDRTTSCSPRTIKPSKMPRDKHYRTARNSESDSGFLSFESDGVKRNEDVDNITKSRNQQNQHENVEISLNDFENSRFEGENDGQSLTGAEIVDLNDNFGEFYDTDKSYDSDSVYDSNDICFRCSCMPRIFKSRSSSRGNNSKRLGSFNSSQSRSLDKNPFDLRGSKILQTISDLQSVLPESDLVNKSKCFLNLVYSEHRCVDPAYCMKAKFSTLNAHLRTLIGCMPKSYCECESKAKWTNCIMNQAGYMSQRRNAICETADRSRQTVGRAFCSFMTLKALLRYELL